MRIPDPHGMTMTVSLYTQKLPFSTATLQTLIPRIPIAHRFLLHSSSSTRTFAPRNLRRFCTRAESSSAGEKGVGESKGQKFDFDLFTIGAGSGGVRASRFAANFGASVTICELPFATISSELTGGVGGT